MSIKYNNLFVDEKYLPILEPNLYTDTVIIPGVTYTDKYQTGPAGQLFIHKLTKGDRVTPGAPGQDFNHEAVADTLIAIQLNNSYRKSEKVYGVQANAVAFDVAEEALANAVKVVRESMQYSAIACMVHEGTKDDDTEEITTAAGAVDALLSLRKAIKDGYGKANYALVSTKIYKLLLEEIGIVVENDPATRNAELMRRFGLTIIECNSFDESAAKYYDYAGVLQAVDLTNVEMIVGYSEAMSIVKNLDALRMHDSPDFIGSLGQVELNIGLRVTSPEQIIIKAKSGSSL